MKNTFGAMPRCDYISCEELTCAKPLSLSQNQWSIASRHAQMYLHNSALTRKIGVIVSIKLATKILRELTDTSCEAPCMLRLAKTSNYKL